MSRVRNADDFRSVFAGIRVRYDKLFRRLIARVRTEYSEGRGVPPWIDLSLEAHLRTYIVNGVLAALNWRMDHSPEDGLPNLVPEAPIRSESTDRTRFLDYLGLENGKLEPLLIVETKRPSSELPTLASASNPASSLSEVLARGLAGEQLGFEWPQWLETIRDYVRSAKRKGRRGPTRVVMTNGDWLIVFLDPNNAFVKTGVPDFGTILVFQNASDVENRFAEVFEALEHSRVLRQLPALAPADVRFSVDPPDVDRVMHGLRLRYVEVPGVAEPSSPTIKVVPILFLRLKYGSWIRVDTSRDFTIPHRSSDLNSHLEDVRHAAEGLLADVNSRLHASYVPVSLLRHYADEEAFASLPGIAREPDDTLIVATGDSTHYLRPEPTVPNCPWHDWAKAQEAGFAAASAIYLRSVQPRAFFKSGEKHHCAHRDVAAAKANALSRLNRDFCGPRSGKDGQAFCEIWQFETQLCCRTCAFETVCTKAKAFQLPCQVSTAPRESSHRTGGRSKRRLRQ